ncbi:MAG TPA: phosphopantetheine-binding protein [Nitrospirota bacterium]|nr:phosphopantetheine-binding protein [Nitrospirota bacterium]
MTVLQDLEKYLLTEIAADSGKRSLGADEDLLEQGIIDSMGILKLVAHIEQTHGIKVLDEDVIPDNFQNLNTIAGFIEQKMKNK